MMLRPPYGLIPFKLNAGEGRPSPFYQDLTKVRACLIRKTGSGGLLPRFPFFALKRAEHRPWNQQQNGGGENLFVPPQTCCWGPLVYIWLNLTGALLPESCRVYIRILAVCSGDPATSSTVPEVFRLSCPCSGSPES